MKLSLFYLFIFLSFGIVHQGRASDTLLLRMEQNLKIAPSKAIFFADSLLLNYENPDSLFWAKLYYFKGKAYKTNKYNDRAIEEYRKALPIFSKRKNYEFEINSLIDLSICNTSLRNFSTSTNQALQALGIAEKNKIFNLIPSCNNALSFIYYSNEDYETALDYLEKSELLQEYQNDRMGLSGTYNNIAIIYKSMKKYDKALEFNTKSLNINKVINNQDGVAKSFNNLGVTYEEMQDFTKAIESYEKAVQINRISGIQNTVPIKNLGEVYLLLKKYDKAFLYFQEALEMELPNNNTNVILDIYKNLITISFEQKDIEKAAQYQIIIDSLHSVISKHDSEQLLKMLESQQNLFYKEIALTNAKSSAKLSRLILIIVLFIFIFAILFFVQRVKYTKLKSKRNKDLLELRLLRSQMNPHFIFNALSAIQNTLADNDPIKSAAYLSRFARLIRRNFEFAAKEQITLAEDLEALENYILTQLLRFDNRFEYQLLIDSNIDVHNIEVPPMLLQPFVENAIEHGLKGAKKNGLLQIKVNKINMNRIEFIVQDNGIGYKRADTRKLHAIEIIKKRLQLIGNADHKSFEIVNLGEGVGTLVKYSLKIDV